MFNFWWQIFDLCVIDMRLNKTYHQHNFTHVKTHSRCAKYFGRGLDYETV